MLCLSSFSFSQNTDAFAKKKPLKDFYQFAGLQEIKPGGRLRQLLNTDLKGMVGNLDRIVPDLIVKDDIYGKNRITKNNKAKPAVSTAEDVVEDDSQFFWWDSETQSNWHDGYIRNAFLLNDTSHITRIKQYVQQILATQDTDGYLGIYAPDLRYHLTSENGELWSKATLYRALLAYYEFTNDTVVLNAVIKAVKNVMVNYPAYASEPFKAQKPFSGVGHGLAFTDVLDKLYFLTNDQTYREYALFLYKDYSSHPQAEEDVQYKNITDSAYKLQCHGVHTYEHIRSLVTAVYASGNDSLKLALQNYLARVEKELTPAGGPTGDEYIVKRTANPTDIGYEYCSIQELFDAYMMLVQKTGNMHYANLAEKIFWNAAQGARHPQNGSICYLKTDNSYQMTGTRNGNDDKKQTRYKYSYAHQDNAVCCAPNAGRITPYYIQNMWFKKDAELVSVLFGSSQFSTIVNGNKVIITQQTNFPDNGKISYEVATEKPTAFTISIRIPSWVPSFTLNAPYTKNGDLISITKKWGKKTVITIDFKYDLQRRDFNETETYFTYGPLILARALSADSIVSRTYPGGFQDMLYKTADENILLFDKSSNGSPTKLNSSIPSFSAKLYSPQTQKNEAVLLTPLYTTILRQVTFKYKDK